MKQLLRDTVREMFGVEREFSTLEVAVFYLLVAVTTGLALYLL